MTKGDISHVADPFIFKLQVQNIRNIFLHRTTLGQLTVDCCRPFINWLVCVIADWYKVLKYGGSRVQHLLGNKLCCSPSSSVYYHDNLRLAAVWMWTHCTFLPIQLYTKSIFIFMILSNSSLTIT